MLKTPFFMSKNQSRGELTMQFLKDIVKQDIFDKQVPDVKHQLETTRIPRHAFILMSVPKLKSSKKDGRFRQVVTMGIFLVNVENMPSQKYIVNDALFNLNGQLLGYANFPTHDDKDAQRAQKWRSYGEPNSANPWDDMASYCQAHIDKSLSQTLEVKTVQIENTKLLAEAEKLRAEVEELKANTNKAKGEKNG